MELVSLQPVLLFHQLRSGLAPVWIHGDWLAKIANISFRYFWESDPIMEVTVMLELSESHCETTVKFIC